MGNGTWYIVADGATTDIWEIKGSNITLNSDLSTLTTYVNNSGATFTGGGKIYHNVTFNELNGSIVVADSNAYFQLTLASSSDANPGSNIIFTAGTTQTTSYLGSSGGTNTHPIVLRSSSSPAQYTINASSTTGLNYINIQDSIASGAAAPFICGNGVVNCSDSGNNTNWNFSYSKYWIGGSGNWSDTNHWSATSGGSGNAGVPSLRDNVFINSQSGSSPNITVNSSSGIHNLDFTGAISPTLSGSYTLSIGGYFKLTPAMTINYTGPILFQPTDLYGHTVSLAGNILSSPVTFNAPSNSIQFTLQDSLNIGNNAITFTRGNLDTNNQAITANSFVSTSTSFPRLLTLGSSIVTLNGAYPVWNVATSSSLNISPGTSKIIVNTDNFAGFNFTGGNQTYNDIQFGGTGTGSATLTDSNTYHNFTILNQPRMVNFTAGTTTTLTGSLVANGSSGKLITLRSTTSGSQYTINSATTNLSYADIKDSAATGAASPFQCGISGHTCTNNGNNTGWNF